MTAVQAARLQTAHRMMHSQTAQTHLVFLLLCQNLSIARLVPHTAEVKPGLKLCQVMEDVGQQEVEKTPQLTQVVLQRCACSNQPGVTAPVAYMMIGAVWTA